MEVCKEKGIETQKQCSSQFNLRIGREPHERPAMSAQAQGKSLNCLAQEVLERSVTA
ncbi:MAG: toxin-antitoxin system HicB family antitoxin [Cyanobium sp.]